VLFRSDSDKNYAEYQAYNVIKDFEVLVDDISNFYIRTNRKRFYNSGTKDQMDAYYVLYHSLKKIITVLSPALPFITDEIWVNMVKEIEKDEVNVKNIEFVEEDKFNDEFLTLNFKKAGMVLKGDVNNVKNALLNMPEKERKENVANFKKGGKVKVLAYELESDLFELKIVAKEGFAIANLNNNLVALDVNLTQELLNEGILREIIRCVQVARKDAGFEISDRINLFIESDNNQIQTVINENKENIMKETLAVSFKDVLPDFETEQEISGSKVKIKVKK